MDCKAVGSISLTSLKLYSEDLRIYFNHVCDPCHHANLPQDHCYVHPLITPMITVIPHQFKCLEAAGFGAPQYLASFKPGSQPVCQMSENDHVRYTLYGTVIV